MGVLTDKAFETDAIIINDTAGVFAGSSTPEVLAPDAPIGSIMLTSGGARYTRTEDNGSGVATDWVFESPPGVAGAGATAFSWRWSDATAMAFPGNNKLRYNNATPASITALAVSVRTNGEFDVTDILAELTAGDKLYLQENGVIANNLFLTVVSITNNTTWFEITVTVDNSGTLPLDKVDVGMYILFKASGAAPVSSVFTRTGAVVAAASDYDASQVDNDSGVAGVFVDDALNTLAAAIPPVAPVDSVFGRTGAVTAQSGDYTAAQVGAAPAAHVGAGGVAEHPVFSNGTEGFVPDPGAGTGLFLRDDGVWATPTGASIPLGWRFETSTVMAAPGNQRFRMNNATPASVTALAFDDQTRDGLDASTVLDNLTAGDAILIQQDDDAAKYVILDVVSSTDNTGWFEVAVTVADSGTIFDNNNDCVVIIVKGAGGGGSATQHDKQFVSASSLTTTTSATPSDLDSMTLTTLDLGGTGTYDIDFTVTWEHNQEQQNEAMTIDIVIGGSTVRTFVQSTGQKMHNREFTFSGVWQATGVADGTIIKLQKAEDGGGTLTIHERQLRIDGVLDSVVVT